MTTPILGDGRPVQVALVDERDACRDVARLLLWRLHEHLHAEICLLERRVAGQGRRIADLHARLREDESPAVASSAGLEEEIAGATSTSVLKPTH